MRFVFLRPVLFHCIIPLISLLGCLSTTNSYGQSTAQKAQADSLFQAATTALQTRDTKTAFPLILKADSLYQQLRLPQDVIKTKILKQRCYIFSKPITDWGIPLYEALPFAQDIEQPGMTSVRLYAALRSFSTTNNQPLIAHYYGSKALEILKKGRLTTDTLYHKSYISTLHGMGRAEVFRYNYKQAESYYAQSLTHARQYRNKSFYLGFRGLFKVYTLTNRHQEIKEMVAEFEREHYAQSQPLYFVYDFYSYYIDYLVQNKLYTEALDQSLVLKKLLITDKFKSHFSAWFLSERIADIYSYQGNHQKAIDELLNAQSLQESLESRTIERAALFTKLAKYYLQLGDYKNAQQYSEEALAINTGIKNSSLTFHAPLDLSKAAKAHKNILLDNLLFKTQLAEALYIKTNDTTYRTTKKQTYETAHELIKRMGHMSDEDAFLSDDQFKRVYGELMSIYQKEWNSSADPTLFEKAMTLRLQSQYVTILNELNVKQDRTDIASIPFIKNLKETYNSYNILSYLWGQDAIYVLNWYNDIQHFDKIPLTVALEKAIDIVIEQTRDHNSSIDQKAQQLVYKTLIEKYIQSDTKTAILPDDKLHLLPFESLSITAEQKEHYFLNQSPVIRITNTAISKPSLPDHKALVLAPFASQAGTFNTRLVKSLEESKGIGTYFKNDLYLDDMATKSSFVDQLADASMIHLATHARANTDDPSRSYIQFYEEKAVDPVTTRLALEEIYNLDLQASIVTLSACETGIGKEIKGKGVQSMANAFTYAGAASTVMSLWKVPDTETATIMTRFYENLHKGLPKDEALQQSKLQYLEANADYPALQHPYYWSGFVISGDPSAILQQTTSWKKPLFIFLGVLILLFFLRKPLFQLFQ